MHGKTGPTDARRSDFGSTTIHSGTIFSFAANEAVDCEEDERPLKTLVGVEARSDGRVRLWFE